MRKRKKDYAEKSDKIISVWGILPGLVVNDLLDMWNDTANDHDIKMAKHKLRHKLITQEEYDQIVNGK